MDHPKKTPQGNVFKETLTRQFPLGNFFSMELLSYAQWQKVGFHDVALDVLEDWEMRIRLSKHYHVAYWDKPLTEIRTHTGGLSNIETAWKINALKYIWRKHRTQLADLSPEKQNAIIKEMDKLNTMFVRQQAKEALGAYDQTQRGNRSEALALSGILYVIIVTLIWIYYLV